MSFSSNFKTRMLFLDQSYETTKHRWVIFEKIRQDGQRIGMRMKMRQEPHAPLAETYVDGTIILHEQFHQLDYRVKQEIRDAIQEVAIKVSEERSPHRTYGDPIREVWQRKLAYAKGAVITGTGDFADFLATKFHAGRQQSNAQQPAPRRR